MAEYKYRLAKWGERDKSLLCPQCGRGRGCFKEYLYEDGAPLDPINHSCGKCDHESSCGYHLAPGEFFKTNPEQRAERVYKPIAVKPKKRIEIPMSFANQCRKQYENNNFVVWVRSLKWSDEQRARLEVALELYNVGTTRDRGTIWWQIDENLIVRTGKKMLYANDGHRMKDNEGNAVGMNWVHSIMKLDDAEHELVQCLFGEHLLRSFPDADVCIVESEKTAILMAAYDARSFDKRIWMATGGKYNIQEMKFYPLRHRKVLLYPDRDAVDEWKERLKKVSYENIILYENWILTTWKPEDGEKADIGDSVLRIITPKIPTIEEAIERMPQLALLHEKFDLEVVDYYRE